MRKIQLIQCTPPWGRNWGLALHIGGPTVTSVLFWEMEKPFLMVMHYSSFSRGGEGAKQSLTASPVKQQQQLCEGLACLLMGKPSQTAVGRARGGIPVFQPDSIAVSSVCAFPGTVPEAPCQVHAAHAKGAEHCTPAAAAPPELPALCVCWRLLRPVEFSPGQKDEG